MFVGPNFVVTVRHGDSDVLSRGAGRARRRRPDLSPSTGRRGAVPGRRPRGRRLRGGHRHASTRTSTRSRPRCSAPTTDDHAERIYKLKREIAEFRRAVRAARCRCSDLADGTVPGIDPATAPASSATSTTTCCGRRTPSRATTGCSPTSCRPTCPAGGPPEPDRGAPERDRRPPERGHAQDLGVGGHRPGAHRDRRRSTA